MKQLLYIALCIAIFPLGYFTGYSQAPKPVECNVFGAVEDAQNLRKQVVELGERLKSDYTIDLALGTSEEWSQAYVDLANDPEVTLPPGASQVAVSALIQAKFGEEARLCNNPNATAQIKNPKKLVNPE